MLGPLQPHLPDGSFCLTFYNGDERKWSDMIPQLHSLCLINCRNTELGILSRTHIEYCNNNIYAFVVAVSAGGVEYGFRLKLEYNIII